ncbi:hypothetical protein [Brucella sp. NBRC 12950]|uniref:hypothetical protein n=1 Tax=Brucella sp. NBRC 12950 TaxID=2994518 RepID=UPI0024A3808C|nr:hypothetical protein [Brucella sp. NBRC 12950]GLU28001.1 hypothetical protein Brsp01_32340 [Brucella sp. NBRC 12950]
MAIDQSAIEKMTPEQRAQLWVNAQKRPENGGTEVIELLKSSGLPIRTGGLSFSDPVWQRMEEIIWSPEARPLMIEATAKGYPALAGVEPLLTRELGDRYSPLDLGTASAGAIVAEVMKILGYRELRKGSMPEGSVAKTGAVWG